MPQNNQDIVNSTEFKDFVKENNLDVMNLESIQVALFTSCYADRHLIERIAKLEEKLMEVGSEITYSYDDGKGNCGMQSLADKWYKKEWISVSESLPEESVLVRVKMRAGCGEGNNFFIKKGKWFNEDGYPVVEGLVESWSKY